MCIRYSAGIGFFAAGGVGQDAAGWFCAFRFRQQCLQCRDRGLHRRDDAGAGRHHGGMDRIVGDLPEHGAVVENLGMPLDVKGEHRRAEHDDEIVLAQRIRELRRRGMQEAREQWMPFGETATRRERTDPDRCIRALGERNHRIDSLLLVDRRPDDERGPLARDDSIRKRARRIRIRAELAADAAGGQRLRGPVPIVDRDRDEGRPARRLHRFVVSAGERRRHVFGTRGLDAVLHIRPRKLGGALGVEKRLQRQNAARLLAGADHHRRLVAKRREDVAERMADARGGMKVDERGVARRLCVAVGHADHGRFLQAEHVLDVVGPVAQERQLGRAGIAENFRDAESAQKIEGSALHGSGRACAFCGLARQRKVLTLEGVAVTPR